MKITLLLTLGLLQVSLKCFSQTIQSFPKNKFIVGCQCKLYPDATYLKTAKESGITNPVSAYICASDKESRTTGTINNIIVTDLSERYKLLPTRLPEKAAARFEQLTLQHYREDLSTNGIKSEIITFRGVSAIHYTFMQMETVPTEALFFIKNKRTYLIQVASRSGLADKFQLVSGTFQFIN